MSKSTHEEKAEIKSIVATLSLKRIPDEDIIQFVLNQTGKSITRMTIYNIRQEIKRESYEWYNTLRGNQYAYIHEFKERISEILSLQKKHHEIIEKNEHNPSIQQVSLAELQRLSITLSNLYDVAPTIINNGPTLSATSENKTVNSEITV